MVPLPQLKTRLLVDLVGPLEPLVLWKAHIFFKLEIWFDFPNKHLLIAHGDLEIMAVMVVKTSEFINL